MHAAKKPSEAAARRPRLPLAPHEALALVATQTFQISGELPRLITFLNRALKDRGLIFGLRQGGAADRFCITIYELPGPVSPDPGRPRRSDIPQS
ncbi:MAG: YpmA family protein [Firmicutes bacterium]|nr:YpmA family protein [Bacillota bacterium]